MKLAELGAVIGRTVGCFGQRYLTAQVWVSLCVCAEGKFLKGSSPLPRLRLPFPSSVHLVHTYKHTKRSQTLPLAQSSRFFEIWVAMSRKASGAPQSRVYRTPLEVSEVPVDRWHTSASKATRPPATPWVQESRKGPEWWTWQPHPSAASRRASTTSAGSRRPPPLRFQPRPTARGSDAFWYPGRWQLGEDSSDVMTATA